MGSKGEEQTSRKAERLSVVWEGQRRLCREKRYLTDTWRVRVMEKGLEELVNQRRWPYGGDYPSRRSWLKGTGQGGGRKLCRWDQGLLGACQRVWALPKEQWEAVKGFFNHWKIWSDFSKKIILATVYRIEWKRREQSKRERGDNLRGEFFPSNTRINSNSWFEAELGKTKLWA